jgi:hypothetical protein
MSKIESGLGAHTSQHRRNIQGKQHKLKGRYSQPKEYFLQGHAKRLFIQNTSVNLRLAAFERLKVTMTGDSELQITIIYQLGSCGESHPLGD